LSHALQHVNQIARFALNTKMLLVFLYRAKF